MAEPTSFSDTEMTVIEKYPDSRRLDHPNFGDVAKTTFAKGVITDFKKVADDPLEVESLVKVEIEEVGESDFIPLFFHPKAQYWDGEEVLATEFDEELGCFKRAWQSFRCGDEVAVMLKEGVPVAVVGFADGVPRIGEDIVKMTTDSSERSFDYPGNTEDDQIVNKTWPDAYFQMSQNKLYEKAEIGIDGTNLKLLKESEFYPGADSQESGGCWLTPSPSFWPEWPGPESMPDFDSPYGTFRECVDGGCTYGVVTLGSVWVSDRKISLWILNVGPILYAVYGLWYNARSIGHYGYVKDDPDTGMMYDGYMRTGQNIYGFERLMVKAAIYSEKTKADVIASLGSFTYAGAKAIYRNDDWWPVTPGVVRQAALSNKMQELCWFDQKYPSEAKYLTRSHTKAELEAAGLWPAGA